MNAEERKARPIATGVLAYFPLAIAEVAHLSKVGNDQHNPGQPLHWAKEKSTDHDDALCRHETDRLSGIVRDTDGERHRAKVAWRALAALEIELETEVNPDLPEGYADRLLDYAASMCKTDPALDRTLLRPMDRGPQMTGHVERRGWSVLGPDPYYEH